MRLAAGFLCVAAALAQQLRPGVWAGRELSALPLPASGYQVYLVGELHGVRETGTVVAEYLARLHAGGLRDVAIEEDAVYGREAQAYVEGKSSTLPPTVCLRAGVLREVRRFNEGRKPDELVRIHLVDIDSPAAAIREHLLSIRDRLAGAGAVRLPDAARVKRQGLRTVAAMERLTRDPELLGELRTVRHSICAYRQGFEVGTGPGKGSPYLEDREAAIASNIADLLRDPGCRGVLALYGADHVSKTPRKDGGSRRNCEFAPLALRLEQAGLRVFSLVAFPLSGHWRWRGRQGEMLWAASDGSLADGETLDRVLAQVPEAKLLYADPRLERLTLPSRDVTGYGVDAFLLFAGATAMENHCAPTAPSSPR